MKEPDAFDSSRLSDGHGADEPFGRPFVKLGPGATRIKLASSLGCPHPNRQIAVALGCEPGGAVGGGAGFLFQRIRISTTATL